MSDPIDEQDIDIASSFRKHRHDVLNLLQLMRAYIQVERYTDAIRVIDNGAMWLQSLTKWQTRCTDIASSLLWMAAQCPHVILSDVDVDWVWNQNIVSETKHLISEIEDGAAKYGFAPVHISFLGNHSNSDYNNQVLCCKLPEGLSESDFLKFVPFARNQHEVSIVVQVT